MSVDTKPAASGADALASPKPRTVTRRDIVPMVAALIAASGVALLCWTAFDWHNVFVVGASFFVAFIIVLTLAEFLREGTDDADVDLVTVERLETATIADEEHGDPAPENKLTLVTEAVPWTVENDRPVRRRQIHGIDFAEGVVALGAGFAFAELLRVVLKMDSLVGFAIWWGLAALLVLFLLVRDRSDTEAAVDRVVAVIVWSAGIGVAAVLVWMVGFVVAKGLPKLTGTFFTEDLSKVGPLSPGGGAKHAIIGTIEQVAIATIVVVPIAIMTAVYLNEIGGRMTKPIRFIVDAMSGLPSIVAGLLVFTVVVPTYGFSGVAAAIALAVLMLPTVTRASELILRTVPDGLREGALALGAPRWRLVQRVVLPTALAGLVTAVILGIARAIGETAPMLLTALGSQRTVNSPVGQPQSDLPLFVWSLIREPNKVQNQRAWTGALVLIMIVFVLFITARLISGRSARRLRRTS
jgi:phosphate transport system permease protein